MPSSRNASVKLSTKKITAYPTNASPASVMRAAPVRRRDCFRWGVWMVGTATTTFLTSRYLNQNRRRWACQENFGVGGPGGRSAGKDAVVDALVEAASALGNGRRAQLIDV